jgi:UDP-2,3-diacylglucosamine hydrolase
VQHDEFEHECIEDMDSSLFLKGRMPTAGMLTTARALTTAEQEDVDFGYPLAKSVAGLDIGQTIIVKEKMVVAVEGAEGTDECIRRAGSLAGDGCVVIKVSKPAQDKRFDIPVIGPGTIKSMIEAGATALAMSADECLVFHRERIATEAEAAGIAMVAVGGLAK